MKTWAAVLLLLMSVLTACGKGGNIEGGAPTVTPPPSTSSPHPNKTFIAGGVVSGGGHQISIGVNARENKILTGGGYVIRMGVPQEVTP